MVDVLSGIAQSSENDSARVAAATHLLDRGWGRPAQIHDSNIEGELRITIRTILEGSNAKIIEGKADDKPE